MVEAKLRVETLENRNNNNPFYGNSLVKKVTEETFYHDKDVRKHIAPRGIKATLKVGDVVMDITINKYYLEHEAATSLSSESTIRCMRSVCGSTLTIRLKMCRSLNGCKLVTLKMVTMQTTSIGYQKIISRQ